MFNIIIWTMAGILTLLINDEKVFKINFILTWVVLMIQLVGNYFDI